MFTSGHKLWSSDHKNESLSASSTNRPSLNSLSFSEQSFSPAVTLSCFYSFLWPSRPFRGKVTRLVNQEELRVEAPLLYIQNSQFKWFNIWPPGLLLGEVFQMCPAGRRSWNWFRTCWRDYICLCLRLGNTSLYLQKSWRLLPLSKTSQMSLSRCFENWRRIWSWGEIRFPLRVRRT